MHTLPSDEFSPVLRHGEFLSNTYPDLGKNGEFDLTRPGTYKVRWGYHPDEVEGVWSGRPLMSNEVQFEILGSDSPAGGLGGSPFPPSDVIIIVPYEAREA